MGAIVILAVLAMTIYEIWRQRVTTIATAEQSLESLSLALAEQTERAFHSVELVLDATVQSVENAGGIAGARGPGLHKTLKERTTGVPVLFGLAVIDAR
ncbi:MAG TPA: hypothetical protein VLL76_06910, partial [Candidatus Omnitrophota bacterium]|nr:hypothetical protein [Candidatus Omnitrophota bacterium]